MTNVFHDIISKNTKVKIENNKVKKKVGEMKDGWIVELISGSID